MLLLIGKLTELRFIRIITLKGVPLPIVTHTPYSLIAKGDHRIYRDFKDVQPKSPRRRRAETKTGEIPGNASCFSRKLYNKKYIAAKN